MKIRRIIGAGAAVAFLLVTAVPALAASPEVDTWSNDVDVPYLDCGTFEAHGVWTVSHRLTIYFDQAGTPIKDHEIIDFRGAFVNPDTGASIPDSGRSIYFDTLAPDYSFLTTVMTGVRHSAYLHAAGRSDFQTGAHHGIDRFDAGVIAACDALGA